MADFDSKDRASSSSISRTSIEFSFNVILINSLFLLVIKIFPPFPGGRNFSTTSYPPSALSYNINQLDFLDIQVRADAAEEATSGGALFA